MRLKFVFAVLLLSTFAFAQQPQQRRIVRPVDNASAIRLQGTLAPRARADLDRGPVAATMPLDRMSIVFSRTAAQQADLDHLLAAQHDPTSAEYHKWLTPEEFADRFGLADVDVRLIGAWLTAQGFTVEEIARSRTWIAFHGTASQVEAAFRSPLHNYMVAGKLHYAPSAEAAVPEAFAPVVAAITGLNDFRPRLHSQVRHPSPQLTSSLSGNHFVVPGDFGTIYNLPEYVNGAFQPGGIDGTGQTIGIVGQTSATGTVAVSTLSSDNATFRSLAGLPAGNLTLTPVGSAPGNFLSGDADEANLDTQWSGAIAPNANIIFAYSGDALNTSLPNLVNQNVATVISISYGDCEASFNPSATASIENSLQLASSFGQTVTVAAGDLGAADCDGTPQKPTAVAAQGLAIDYPSSSIYVTAMGGSSFTGDSTATPVNGVAPAQTYWNSSSDPNDTKPSAFSYIPEVVWNDTPGSSPAANVGTGGGVSKKFAKPSWQVGTGVPADGQRDIPDLAFASSSSHDGYLMCSQGSCQTGYRRNSDQTFTVIGGTSAAAPAFIGVAALINQSLNARQGNLNPKIYPLAASAPWAFNDITTGDNKVVCSVGTPDCATSPIGYSAGPGYDLVTGWGSVDVTALIHAFENSPNPHFLVLPNSRYATLPSGGSSTIPLSVTPKEGFAGTVSLTCGLSSSLAGATCNYDTTSVNTPGSANVTIQAGSIQGSQTGTATLTGTSSNVTNSVVINVSVTAADFSIAAGNATETVSTGSSTTDTITVTPTQGFTGSVSFTCSGTTGITCSLGTNPATISSTTAATSSLTVNAASSATTGSVTITATSGSLSHTLQIPVTVNVVQPNFNLTVASPVVSISSGGLITDNLTVAAVGGFNSDVALTCGVPSSLGTTTCTINPATVVGGNGTALITLKGAVLSRDLGGPLPFQHRDLGVYASYVFSLGFVMLGAPAAGGRRRNRREWMSIAKMVLLALLVVSVMFGAVSCGGGNSGGGGNNTGPTPLTGNVTVTGTGGGITQTVTINVTVI